MIFADPPYDLSQDNFEKIIELIFENELLAEDGMLIVEHSKHTHLDQLPNFSFQKNMFQLRFQLYLKARIIGLKDSFVFLYN